ncbi:MAG: hypothetical protein AAGF11_47770 [Myxococcota bacterium]
MPQQLLQNPTFSLLSMLALLATGCPGDDGSAEGGSGDSSSTSDPTTTETPPTTMNSTGPGGSGSTAADETATDTGNPTCDVSLDDWTAPDWDANAASALALRDQLDTLTGDMTMRGAETGAVMIGALSELTDVWNAGDPSLASAANPGYVAVVEASLEDFIDILDAGVVSLIDMDGNWTPGNAGGIWGEDSRGINEGGLEVRQLVDKGAYSAGILYAYALSLTEGEINAATIDAIAAAWGNNPTLDTEDLTDAAGYSYSMGFHADMATALTAAKVLSDNPDCTAERDEAVVTFFNLWELTMYARVVFYGNRAEGKLLAAMTETELASVLHDLAEGIGLGAGFIGLPEPASGPLSGAGRVITDDQITEIMDAYGVDLTNLGASTTGLFVESLPDLETANTEAEAVVMTVFEVDEAAIMGYANPTPG